MREMPRWRDTTGTGCRNVARSVPEKASVDVVMCLIAACRPVHHLQHVDAAGRDEPPHQKSREEKKSNIEPRRVIPRSGIAWCGSQATATVTRTMSSAKRQKNLIFSRTTP